MLHCFLFFLPFLSGLFGLLLVWVLKCHLKGRNMLRRGARDSGALSPFCSQGEAEQPTVTRGSWGAPAHTDKFSHIITQIQQVWPGKKMSGKKKIQVMVMKNIVTYKTAFTGKSKKELKTRIWQNVVSDKSSGVWFSPFESETSTSMKTPLWRQKVPLSLCAGLGWKQDPQVLNSQG